jgi:hypothetical protein
VTFAVGPGVAVSVGCGGAVVPGGSVGSGVGELAGVEDAVGDGEEEPPPPSDGDGLGCGDAVIVGVGIGAWLWLGPGLLCGGGWEWRERCRRVIPCERRGAMLLLAALPTPGVAECRGGRTARLGAGVVVGRGVGSPRVSGRPFSLGRGRTRFCSVECCEFCVWPDIRGNSTAPAPPTARASASVQTSSSTQACSLAAVDTGSLPKAVRASVRTELQACRHDVARGSSASRIRTRFRN